MTSSKANIKVVPKVLLATNASMFLVVVVVAAAYDIVVVVVVNMLYAHLAGRVIN